MMTWAGGSSASRFSVPDDTGRGRQSRERIASLTIHKPRLKYDPVCLVPSGSTSRAVRVIESRRLSLTGLANAGIIGA